MKVLRTTLFWLHLACGVSAGIVILVMSATGALLAFKPQIVRLIDHDVRVVEPLPSEFRAGFRELLVSALGSSPGARLASVTVDAEPSASVAVAFDQGG